jgi:hypothetical protein
MTVSFRAAAGPDELTLAVGGKRPGCAEQDSDRSAAVF